MSASLHIAGLSVAFPSTTGTWSQAVDDVSIDVHAGERVGLVGESGSGKSVTALAALGLVPAPGRITSGSVTIDSARQARGAVGLVFQEATTALNPVFSVGYQLGETLRQHRPLSRKAARLRSLELLEEVGLSDPELMLRAYPHQLSGGQVQRVMIAMTLATDPLLLIADEPTTALDLFTQAQILRLFQKISEHKGIGVLLISHDLALVADLVERVYVMYRGKIVEQGPADAIFTDPRHPYTRLLLASAPGRGTILDAENLTTGGRIGGAVEHGCSFAPRCISVEATCRHTAPELREIDGGRRVRCFVLPAVEERQ